MALKPKFDHCQPISKHHKTQMAEQPKPPRHCRVFVFTLIRLVAVGDRATSLFPYQAARIVPALAIADFHKIHPGREPLAAQLYAGHFA